MRPRARTTPHSASGSEEGRRDWEKCKSGWEKNRQEGREGAKAQVLNLR